MSMHAVSGAGIARPEHWSPRQWRQLLALASPDVLCHAMWMVLDDPEVVLGPHHDGNGVPTWRSMINGGWPLAWNARASSAVRIAFAQISARGRAREERPVHWSADQWEALCSEVDTGLCFEGLYVLTADPDQSLRHLRARPKLEIPAISPNGGACWLAGTAGALEETYMRIVAFARSRGETGMVRAHVPYAIKADSTSLPKETVNGYLRELVRRGELRRVKGAAPGRGGGDLYLAVTDRDLEPADEPIEDQR